MSACSQIQTPPCNITLRIKCLLSRILTLVEGMIPIPCPLLVFLCLAFCYLARMNQLLTSEHPQVPIFCLKGSQTNLLMEPLLLWLLLEMRLQEWQVIHIQTRILHRLQLRPRDQQYPQLV